MIKIKNLKEKIKGAIIILSVVFFSIMYASYNLYVKLQPYSLYVVFLCIMSLLIIDYKKIINQRKKTLIVVLLTIANVFLGSILNSTGFGSIFIMIILLSLILYSEIANFSDKQIKICSLIVLIGNIAFLLSDKKLYNTNVCGYLALAMMPFSLMFLIGNREYSKRRTILGIILSIPLILLTIKVIIESESRGVLLGLISFLIIMLIKNKYLMSKSIFNILVAGILIFEIGFVFLYVQLWNNGVDFSIPYTNKSLYSGREAIWTELLRQLDNNYLYGIGSNYNIQSFSQLNIHNSLLHILVIYGGTNFVLFILLFYNMLKGTNRNINNNRYNKIFMAAIIGMLVVGFFETNLEWSEVNIYFILSVLFCFSTNKERKETNKDEQ